MEKIYVKHDPDFMNTAAISAISIVILWLISVFAVYHFTVEFAMLLSMLSLFILLSICYFLSAIKTVVEYDTEKVRWKWLWLEYTVDLDKMESVHYTIASKFTRYGCIRRFEIVFKTKDRELRLNDLIKKEDLEKYIEGKYDDIKLMRLYKFIESACPEKSKGFYKHLTRARALPEAAT